MSNLLNVKQKEYTGRKNYIGLIPYRVIAVNPSKEQLMSILKTENVQEPNYQNNGATRVDFWLRNDELDFVTKLSIFMENKEKVSTKGNTLFINQKNQTTWAESLDAIAAKPNMKWFDLSTARACMIGEDVLYNFIVTYINADTSEGGIMLDNLQRIIDGDVSELEKLFEHFNERTIKLLTGNKDGRTRIYTNYFVKAEVRSVRALMNALEERAFDAIYPEELDVIREFEIGSVKQTKESVERIVEESGDSSLF